jgi:hypothetical protein
MCSSAISPTYRLIAATLAAVSKVALPSAANHCPRYCWLKVKA